MYEVTFKRNVKFGRDLYKKGDSLTVEEEDYKEMLSVGVVDETEPVKEKAKPKPAPKKKSGD
ncbi:hypothetical protein ABZ756_02135 [Mammaliicoccus sciuri]